MTHQRSKRLANCVRVGAEYADERFRLPNVMHVLRNITAIRSIESILKKKADLMAQQADTSTPAGVREAHENNRGAAYFGGEA